MQTAWFLFFYSSTKTGTTRKRSYVCPLFNTPGLILIQRFPMFSTCFLQDVGSQRAKLQFQVKNNSLLARVSDNTVDMPLHTPPVNVSSVSFYIQISFVCFPKGIFKNEKLIIFCTFPMQNSWTGCYYDSVADCGDVQRLYVKPQTAVKNMPMFLGLLVCERRQNSESGRSIWNTLRQDVRW